MSKPYAKVYVGGLGEQGRKEEIEREFEKYGPLHDVWVARNPPGFAFVEFEDQRDAEDAIKALDGKTICGMEVRVEMSRHRGGRGRGGGGGGGGYRGGDRYGGGRRDDRHDRYDNRSRSPYRWVNLPFESSFARILQNNFLIKLTRNKYMYCIDSRLKYYTYYCF